MSKSIPLPPELLSKVFSYTTKYPQKYKMISKGVSSYIENRSLGEFLDKYPRILWSIQHAQYQLNRATILSQWEDFNIILDLYVNSNAKQIDKSDAIKYAIAIAHRYGKDELVDRLIYKHKPKMNFYKLSKYNYTRDESDINRVNDFNDHTIELILFTRLYRLPEFKDQVMDELGRFIYDFKSNNQLDIDRIEDLESHIGNVDAKSWYALTGKHNVYLKSYKLGFLYDVPIDQNKDIYTYIIMNGEMNTSEFVEGNLYDIFTLNIITVSIMNAVGTFIKNHKAPIALNVDETDDENMSPLLLKLLIPKLNMTILPLKNHSPSTLEVLYALKKISLEDYMKQMNIGLM